MPRPRVKLMPEYGCVWPLWPVDGDSAGPGDLPISAELGDDLYAWQRDFEEHFHYERGWDGAEARDAWMRSAWGLIKRLERELPDHELVVDLWPTFQQVLQD